MKRRSILIITVLLAALVLFALVLKEAEPAVPATAEIKDIPSPPEIVSTITLASAGDIMAHMPQVQAALDRESGEYFTPCFAPVRLIFGGRYFPANLETTLAPISIIPTIPGSSASGWPVRKMGRFRPLSTANNHSWTGVRRGLRPDHLAANDLSPLALPQLGERDK